MTPMNLDHVFLTRFNLPSGGAEQAIRAREGWLRDRVGLFERYCLPSMRAQTDREFSWIIYFDPQSPAWLRVWIDRINNDGIFNPVFRAAVDDAALRHDLQLVVGTPQARLLTTNLDNDDGLSSDFVARLKATALAASPERHALYLTRGLIKNGQRLYTRTDKNNAFCSVVESWQEPTSCWANWHNLLGQQMPVIRESGPPAWLQVVHGTNVSNRVRGRRANPQQHRRGFPGLLDDLESPAWGELIAEYTIGTALRGGREVARAGIKWAAMKLLGRDGLDRARALCSNLAAKSLRRGA